MDELRRWRPDDVMRRAALGDGSWAAREAGEDTRFRAWHELSAAHRALLLALSVLLLVASGAGGAIALLGASAPAPGLYSTDVRATHLRAAQATAITGRIDPSVVDVASLVITPQGLANVAGTGMLVSRSGLVVTNNHVVEEATRITVTLPLTNVRYSASFLGADPTDDVAVLSIRPTAGQLPAVRFADSERLSVGAAVLAFGNSLGTGRAPLRSQGTVTAVGQQITATSETGADAEHLRNMIETDVPISPGESGGPLVDNRGRVIGMDTAAVPASASLKVPLAFAIPSRRLRRILHEILLRRSGGGIVLGPPAYLGIEGTADRSHDGVEVLGVEPATPAATAGLEAGDVVVSFEGRATPSMGRLAALIDADRPGRVVRLVYRAHHRLRRATVRLAAGPDP